MMKPAFRRAQSGHAAMLFAMIVPVLFSAFILGTDGAKALQNKARLGEAVEVAGLAVAAKNSDSVSGNIKTVVDYLKYYFPDAEISNNNIAVTKIACEDNSECDENDEPYSEYRITATITEDTWFGSDNSAIVDLGKNYDVSEYMAVRKFQGEAVDIILVADFSASMYNTWSGGSQRKFEDLKDVISYVSDEIKNYNDTDNREDSTMGLVGFDFYSSNYTGGGTRQFYSHIYCSYYRQTIRYHGRNYTGNYSSPDGRCYSSNPIWPDYNVWDVSKTISNIFNESAVVHSDPWYKSDVTNVSVFHDIALTSDISSFKSEVASGSDFNIPQNTGSGTFFLAGLIKAAQMIRTGDNTRRLLIILSDGADSYVDNSANLTDQLVDAGICDEIVDTLASDTTSGGKEIKASLAVIGFDYSVTDYPQLSNCVGSDNIYEASDKDSIKSKILELISEEIGHLAPDSTN